MILFKKLSCNPPRCPVSVAHHSSWYGAWSYLSQVWRSLILKYLGFPILRKTRRLFVFAHFQTENRLMLSSGCSNSFGKLK